MAQSSSADEQVDTWPLGGFPHDTLKRKALYNKFSIFLELIEQVADMYHLIAFKPINSLDWSHLKLKEANPSNYSFI